MFLNCHYLTDNQWDNYFAFVIQQSIDNPFAHVISATTAEELKSKVINRLNKNLDTFFVYTFWAENKCLASIEISMPSDTESYAYLLSNSVLLHNNLGKDIVLFLREFCVKNTLTKIRITCSGMHTQQLLAQQTEITWLIQDVIQELHSSDINMRQLMLYIDLGYPVLQEYNLSLSFHNFLPDDILDKYLLFHSSIVHDIIVFDKKNGELPISRAAILGRYEYIKKKRGNAWYFILQDEATNIVGLTEIWRVSAITSVIDGGLTAIARPYRQKGLALFLKSKMIQKIVNSVPEFELINTANSVVNVPILRVNEKLNFKKVAEESIFEFLR